MEKAGKTVVPLAKRQRLKRGSCMALLLLLHCALLTCAQGPGPGPGKTIANNSVVQTEAPPSSSSSSSKSRSVDTRVQFEVAEEQPVGTLVGKIPTKPGFTYRFNELPVEFELNATTGAIRTTAVLDREALAVTRFDLVILSSQPTYPIEVRVTVLDINDNAPVFPEPSLRVSFAESATPGTRVILDTATDRDAGANAVATDYVIVSGNEDERFRLVVITNPSGESPYLNLETVAALDRENRATYQLNVSARDGGRPPLLGHLLVNVSVLDVNDNPPIFDHSDYVVSLNESVPAGSSVLQVRATDSDDAENARVTYYLAEAETRFEVDADTGVIRTQEKLACRQHCPGGRNCPKSCVFTVFAHDAGAPRQDGRTYVTVNLQDANDHDPVVRFRYFPATGTLATVDENATNGTVVAAVSVVDPDDGPNGETRVRISAGNERGHFRLERTPSFDIVRVAATLDRERVERYNLTVVATDGGQPSRSSTAFLIIQVNDVNDHAPVFERRNYSAVLSEGVPVGTYVASVTATDEDTGINSRVYYAVVSGNERHWFDVDVISGLVTTARPLDREQQASVRLKLSARDGGPSPRWAYTHLRVDVTDENDEAPRFDDAALNVSMMENSPHGSPVATLRALDGDQGANGSVVYSLDAATERAYPGAFAVNATSGQLATRLPLDRERSAAYVLRVVASDRGARPLSATATVSLHVVDVNDNDPVFYPLRYFATVEESAAPGTAVARVRASDPDEGLHADLRYAIVDGAEGAFEIDAETGAVRTTAKLGKWTTRAQYRLTVVAKDLGERRSAENAVLDVVVESNRLPRGGAVAFGQPKGYAFAVAEDAEAGREVGRVSAAVEAPRYSIIGGDEGHAFAIDEHSGVVVTARAIDREVQERYALLVLAQSGARHGVASVNVSVDDVNDNAPRIRGGAQAAAAVPENWPVGHEVYSARAEDPDRGANGRVTYALMSDPDAAFSVDRDTGMVYLRKAVDYETKSSYRVEVLATDGGAPPLSAKLTLAVSVEDVNDHTPRFEHLQVETSLSEGTAVNDRFFGLSASDGDAGENGRVAYAIAAGAGAKFGIFPDGHLYVKSALDREAQSYYELTVVARDHGRPAARSSSVAVVIHVLDENDNPPRFANRTFRFRLPENEPPDTYVGRLRASDADAGRNAELSFTLSGAQDGFTVDPKTGVLKTTQYFDHEKLLLTTGQSVVALEAFVADNGVVRRQDEARVLVQVLDVNDNVPQFARAPYRASLSEAAAPGSPVLRVSATDADGGAGGHLSYFIADGNLDERFGVDAESGQLTLLKPLDREAVAEYALTMVARDAGLPASLSATATVTVHVLDENDNAPQVTAGAADVAVAENATVGTLLTQFRAEDADTGVNGDVLFYIGAGNIQETFRIDAVTGALYLNKPLDYESRATYALNITVTDGGAPHLTTAVPFAVRVLDVNDNPPSFPSVAIVRQIQEGIPLNSPVVTVVAIDPDAGDNRQVRYALVRQEPDGGGQPLFAIRPETGVVYTLGDIDREYSDTFRLTVAAEDRATPPSARLRAEKLVTVIVEDVNDNAPRFASLAAAALAPGAEKGATVCVVSASDADANENGKVTYDLVTGSGDLFVLDRNTGRLYLSRRYDGPPALHALVIRASDGAVAAQRKTAESQLTVVGVAPGGPGAPRFARDEYRAEIAENETVGLSVLTVGGGGGGGDLHYYVTGINSNGIDQPRVFDVDRRSGVLSTAAVLDHESGFVEYLVDVAAVDRAGSAIAASFTKVKISLLDKNDSPPSFRNVSRSYSVSEDALPGFLVGRFAAEDPDKDGALAYRLVDGGDGRFALDASSGALTLHAPLDREEKAFYDLVLEADDGVQRSRVSVSIAVTDSNDNAPVFSRSAYSFDIPEDAVRGARVGTVLATDADDAANAQIGYSVISDWGNDVFSLNPQTGVFTLTSHLDYEQTQHYIFVVQAQDSGQSRLSSTVSVYINVLDLNDNAPLFDPMSYSDEVFENVTVGTSIIKVSATDQDSGENGEIAYSIVDGNTDGRFGISRNGTVFTAKPLDRELQSFYNLYVTAEDHGQHKRLSSTIQVNIILKDVNDNAPEFVTPNETAISENVPFNTVVMAVKAVDRDEGRNSYVEYGLQQTSPSGEAKFTIGPVDGLLRVSGRLDREAAAAYVLRVTATDRGHPPNAAATEVRVRVLDENDNGPIFDPVHYSATVAENASSGLSVLRVSATDQDEGANGRLRYSVVAGDKNHDFQVAEDSGVVRVVNELDYETRSVYVLTVQVEDGGAEPRYDSATVTISVTDCNDNPPVFVDSPYVVRVMENAAAAPPPAAVAAVRALDHDAPPNGQVRYFLKDGDHGLFRINGTTGDISVHKALDRETESEYELVVIAMDSGTPRLTGTGTVQVLVDDVNDNSPVFPSSEYVASLGENLLPNTSIFSVTATDLDEGQNSVVRYSLFGEGEKKFKIDQRTGEIFARVSLDREDVARYELTIVATDMGLTESLNATAQLLLLVEDENDNYPKFDQEMYTVYLPDPTAAGQFVFGATALDRDAGPNSLLTYELMGPDASKFSLSKDTGVVKAANVLSGQKEPFRFQVKASDHGTPALSSTASVEVKLHPSQNFPTFPPAERSFTLSESDFNKVVTTVAARSPKAGALGEIRYSMAGGNVGDIFTVDKSSGKLVISGRLDYETTAHYELWVEAADGDTPPVHNVVAINVTVTDANDNSPAFEKSTYNASVPEEEYPPVTVLTVKATDADSGVNGQLKYKLREEGNVAGAFSVDARTGRVYTNAKLDRETLGLYTLMLEAVDQGSPPNTGSTTVLVNLLDKNDNPPRFTRLFSANVTENADLGAFVIQVTSSDRDIGPNANASYSFTENPGGRFRIDSVSGNVTVAAQIDREMQDEYSLRVLAKDGSWRQETPITIAVQDVNDNAPVFEEKSYTFNFPELQRNVAFVGKVMAIDRDKQGLNAYVSYSLKQTSDFFDIDPSSGEIYSKHALRYKHTSRGPSPENRHALVILAKDHGKPPLTSECAIVVNVVDSNNNPPVFTESSYFSPIPESAAAGLSVLRVQAVDNEDYGANAEIEYAAGGGNASDYLTIDKASGWIKVTAPVMGHGGEVLILQVKGMDKGIPPQKVDTSAHFIVTGENRFSPTFSTPNHQVIVPEDEAVSSDIITLSATDADSGLNGQLLYSITGGNEDARFGIDPKTGRVSIAQALDYEQLNEYRINVTAEDRGFHRLSAVALLSVVVTDVNDNPPVFESALYDAYIAENSKVGTSVFRLRATDADSGRHAVVQYSIVGGDGKEQFAVDAQTGAVTSRASFDAEEKDAYTLEVLASNPDAAQYGSAKLVVHVTGRNEFYPRFVQSAFQFTVSESSPVGTAVGAVVATDRDAGVDGEVLYLLVGSSGNRGFVVNPQTGVIYVARRLDRESLSRIVLTVVAKNRGPIRGNDTDEAQVVIRVQDGNDPPAFAEALYEAHVSEDSAAGAKVSAVRATDRDTRPANSHFTYSIIGGNQEGTFKIDPLSGEIRTAAALDREAVPVYNLTVAAIDSGVPPQTGTTVMKVYVDDVNDNGPELDPPLQTGSVAEDEPADAVVMKLTVLDPDLPPNGAPFLFAIVDGEHKDLFAIDRAKGLVRTRQPLDREATPELHFVVEVSDAGNPPIRSRFPLTVHVRDKNDNPSSPRNLTILAYALTGSAAEPPPERILLADAHPLDPDIANRFQCKIVSASSDAFSVRDGCSLYAERGVTPGQHALRLAGNDGSHPDVTVTAQVRVRRLDNRTVENCVTVRIPNITASAFVGTHLSTFSEAVDQLLGPFEATALVFSVAQEGDNVEVFIAGDAGANEDGSEGFVLGRDLAQVLSGGGLGRTLGRSLTVDYDPCDDSPCRNGGQCSSAVVVTARNTSVAASPTLVLSSTAVRKVVTCKCHGGFAGPRCEYRTDPCAPNPCQNGGSCTRQGRGFLCACSALHRGKVCELERTDACANAPCRNGGTCQETPDGNYFCMCRPGFRGGLCEVVSDGCRPNPCDNGATCVGTKPGFRCACRPGFYGRHCERSTHGFHELSYMAFRALDSNSNDIAVVFSTSKPDGLLVYNYGPPLGGRSDFVALEIERGQLRFLFGGARTAIAALHLNSSVADGNWYKVIVTRNGRMATMSVAACWDNGATCQECVPGDAKCSTEMQGQAGALNFNNENMYLGGIPSIRAITDRPGQVRTDDFVGCVQSVSVNGQALDLGNPLSSRGTSNTCPRYEAVCSSDPCGEGGRCIDQWFGHSCICENDILASDCLEAFQPYTFEGGTYVEFRVGEKHRRRQLLEPSGSPIREIRSIINKKWNSLSLQFRTSASEGILLFLATNEDFTIVYIKDSILHYSSKLGLQPPINISISESAVSNGEWHNVSLLQIDNTVYIALDHVENKKQLDASSVHEFLDPYLTKVIVGGIDSDFFGRNEVVSNFEGCIASFIVDGEVQNFNTSNGIFQATSHGRLKRGCMGPVQVQGAVATDPLNIGVTLVIVFFVVLIVAILISFIVFRRRRQKRDKGQAGGIKPNGNVLLGSSPADSTGSHQDSGYAENGEVADEALRNHFIQELANKKYKEREVADRPQRPDIIEREIVNKPPVMSRQSDEQGMKDISNLSTVSAMQDSEAPEHYDLENASSIAPSDIDIVYHYKGYRDGNMRKYKTNPHVANYHKQNHRHSPHFFQPSGMLRESPHGALRQGAGVGVPLRDSPSVLKMQSTPLARLSPSSELSQQTPRILTLQDISGRPLQSALLATSQGRGVKSFKEPVTNSERSLNSPVSHMSRSSGSAHSNSQGKSNGAAKKKPNGVQGIAIGLTAEEIDRLNTRPRNSSLVSTLDVVSSSSDEENVEKDKLAELMEANAELLEAADSSTDESGNDSFTCSEFEYENNYEKPGREFRTGNMIFSKLAEVDNENDEDFAKAYDGFESFRGSLSTLVASDDDVSNMSYKPPNGSSFRWDCLLNWGPSFESMVGVFKDIAELPDTNVNNPKSNAKPGEEYV